jgi:uncharacterized membrane protein YjjP (DUF1212 family)
MDVDRPTPMIDPSGTPAGVADESLDMLVRAAPRRQAAGEGFDERVELVVSFARALLRFGVGAHRVEEALEGLAASLDLKVDAFCTATALIVTLQKAGQVRTQVVRVTPGGTDLERISALHDLVGRIERRELTPDDAEERVLAILMRPPRYGALPMIGAYALVSAASAILLGGGGLDVPVSAVLGGAVGALAAAAARMPTLGRLLPAIAAVSVSFLGSALAATGTNVRPSVLLLAAIVVLLPGLTVTTSIIELATGHLVAGTGRLAGGVVTFLQLGFGVALGQQLGSLLPRLPRVHEAPDLPSWVTALAPLGAGLGLLVLLRGKPQDRWWILFAVALATAGSRLGGWLMGAELGAFVAALLVASAANALGRLRDRPAALVLVPGIMFLVPGSVGFLGVRSMLDDDVTTGVETFFRMFLVAMAIAAGVLVATEAVPPRRAM